MSEVQVMEYSGLAEVLSSVESVFRSAIAGSGLEQRFSELWRSAADSERVQKLAGVVTLDRRRAARATAEDVVLFEMGLEQEHMEQAAGEWIAELRQAFPQELSGQTRFERYRELLHNGKRVQ